MRASRHSSLGVNVGPFLAILLIAATALSLVASPVWAQNQPPGPGAQPKRPAGKQPPAKQPPAPAPKQPTPPVAPRRSYVPSPVDAEQRANRLAVQKLLRGGTLSQGQRAVFETYYKTYALPRWTDPAKLPELEKKENFNLPDCRRELGNELKLAKGKPVHDELVRLALQFFVPEASNAARHPASRVNAMLAIGELNATEPGTGGAKPVPWPDALPALFRAFTDANQLDAVRVAALLGILRHAQLDIADAQTRSQIGAEVLKLARTKDDPRRSAEGQVWVRARAIEVLGWLKDPGPQNAVVNALAAIVADQTEDLLVRRAAAEALGRLSLPAGQGLDGEQMSVGLAQLAADACAAELARMEEEAERKPRARRPMMGGMMGDEAYDMYETDMYETDMGEGPGSYGGAPMYSGAPMMSSGPMGPGYPSPYGQRKEEEEDDTFNNRRRLKTFTNAVLLGLSGIGYYDWPDWMRENADTLPSKGTAGVTAAAQSQLVITLIQRVDSLSTLCDNKEERNREDFTAELETQLGQLTEALGTASAPAPAIQPPAKTQPAGAAAGGAASPLAAPTGNP